MRLYLKSAIKLALMLFVLGLLPSALAQNNATGGLTSQNQGLAISPIDAERLDNTKNTDPNNTNLATTKQGNNASSNTAPIATQPNKASSNPNNQTTTNPNAPTDGDNPTLLDALYPNESELSRANTELLTQNTELNRRVDDLTTQVNVLVRERSGQLFTYGAMTALVFLIIGFVMGKLISRRR